MVVLRASKGGCLEEKPNRFDPVGVSLGEDGLLSSNSTELTKEFLLEPVDVSPGLKFTEGKGGGVTSLENTAVSSLTLPVLHPTNGRFTISVDLFQCKPIAQSLTGGSQRWLLES